MLKIHELATGHGTKKVGQHLTATLQAGKLTALLGPNGAGKSTLLRTLAGIIPPLRTPFSQIQAPIRIEDKDIRHLSPRQLARKLSIVLTARPEADVLTAEQVVEMGRIPHVHMLSTLSQTDRKVVEQAMQLTNTLHFATRAVNTLSDGERQRVFIAKALAQATPVILLDEPTAYLDFPSKIEMLQLLTHLAHKEQKAILLSTHDVEAALQFADTLWMLRSDRIIEGPPIQLAQNGEISAFFDSDTLHFDVQNRRFLYNLTSKF